MIFDREKAKVCVSQRGGCECACAHVRERMCLCVCMRACVCVRACPCVSPCVCAWSCGSWAVGVLVGRRIPASPPLYAGCVRRSE